MRSFSPWTRLGFSPSADLTETSSRITISSTTRPHVLTAAVRPPIGFAEPGLTTALVTPPRSASLKPTSAGLIASSARSFAPSTTVLSFVSSPDQPSPSSWTPRWPWASTSPGVSTIPDPSTTVREPSCGTATSAAVPTCAIRPSRTSSTPSSRGAARFPSASATGRMRAPTTARSLTAGTGMERYTATPGMWGLADR